MSDEDLYLIFDPMYPRNSGVHLTSEPLSELLVFCTFFLISFFIYIIIMKKKKKNQKNKIFELKKNFYKINIGYEKKALRNFNIENKTFFPNLFL
jgi:Golgi nucleoside diphosphatase